MRGWTGKDKEEREGGQGKVMRKLREDRRRQRGKGGRTREGQEEREGDRRR